MILILDNIRSAYNTGAILRTADFFGIKEVYLCGITPDLTHKEVKKTALGTEKTLSVKKYHSTLRLIKKLKADEYTILALEQHARAIPLYEYKIIMSITMSARRADRFGLKLEKVVLIVGNEINGVHKKILEIADSILEIPKKGNKESLNVSVATGIAIYSLLLE